MTLETIQLNCPCCWEPQSFQTEVPDGALTLVIDCEICCNPIRIELRKETSGEISIEASSANE